LPCAIYDTIMRELNTGLPGKFFHDATNRRLADGRGVFLVLEVSGKWTQR